MRVAGKEAQRGSRQSDMRMPFITHVDEDDFAVADDVADRSDDPRRRPMAGPGSVQLGVPPPTFSRSGRSTRVPRRSGAVIVQTRKLSPRSCSSGSATL